MVSSPLYIKRFAPFGGVNLDNSKISQNPQEASDGRNWMYGRNNEITKRPGSKIVYSSFNNIGYRSKFDIYYNSGTLQYGDISVKDSFCIGLIPFAYNTTNKFYGSDLTRKDKLVAVIGSLDPATVGFNFYERAEKNVTFSYSGIQNFKFNMEASLIDNNFYLVITENNSVIYTSPALGPSNSPTPVLISALIAAVDALADYAAVSSTGQIYPYYAETGFGVSGLALPVSPGPASSLGPFDINNSAAFLDSSYFLSIPHDYQRTAYGKPSKIVTFFSKQADEISKSATPLQVTYTNIKNSLYVAGGRNVDSANYIFLGVAKYDGYRIKPAGLYKVDSISFNASALVGTAIFPAGAIYKWGVTVEYTDGNGDTIESDMTLMPTSYTIPALGKDEITLNVFPYAYSPQTIPNIESQYPKAYRIETTGTGITKTVITHTAGGQHYLLPGDEIYMPVAAGVYGTRRILSVTGTVITIDSPATTTIGDACSLNYKLNLWRTKDQGNDLFLTKSYPMFYPLLTTLKDITSEANLGRKYIYPLKNHLPPPPGKICCEHQGLLVVADIDTWYYDYSDLQSKIESNKNTVYYSTDEHQEYFHLANSFTLPLNESEEITGIKSLSGTLYIFTSKKIFYVQGVLNDTFSVKILVNNIGCISHNSIVEINGTFYFPSTDNVYALSEGSLPTPIGNQIRNVLRTKIKEKSNSLNEITYYYNRACAGYLKKLDLYVLSVPASGRTSTTIYPPAFNPTYSIIFVYDIRKNQWSFWQDLHITSFASFNDELWFATSDPPSNLFNSTIRKFLQDDTSYQSYADGSVPINFDYKSSWENLDVPGVQKLANNLTIYALDNKINRDYTVDVTVDKDFGYNTRNTVFRLNFPFLSDSQNAYFAYSKLDSNKSRSMRISFSNNNMYENVCISGYELEVAPDIQTVNKK